MQKEYFFEVNMYKGYWFFVDDQYSTPWHDREKRRITEPFDFSVSPPLFLDFLKLDPESYESFREFTERFGFNWFAAFDPIGPYNLEVELEKRLNAKKKGKEVTPITESYMRSCLKRMTEVINGEQELLRIVWDIFKKYQAKKFFSDVLCSDFHWALDQNFKAREGLVLKPVILSEAGVVKILEVPFSEYLTAICHFEAWQAFRNKWDIKPCQNCGRGFFSAKKNEYYCDRLAPFNQIRNLNAKDLKKQTCKKLGPQIRFNKELEENKAKRAYREEYKRRAARLSYLKHRKRDAKLYEAELVEFEKWKKEREVKR